MDLIPRESRGLEDLLGPWILNYSMHHTTCKTGKSSDCWALHRDFNAIGLGWGECAFLTSAQVMLMGPPLENPCPSSCCSFQYWSKLFCSKPMKCCHYLNEMLPLLKGSPGISPNPWAISEVSGARALSILQNQRSCWKIFLSGSPVPTLGGLGVKPAAARCDFYG